jgi:hypothetical protein
MTKTEHLQFLVLMIPTFLILTAAAVSMADLASPAAQPVYLPPTRASPPTWSGTTGRPNSNPPLDGQMKLSRGRAILPR